MVWLVMGICQHMLQRLAVIKIMFHKYITSAINLKT